MRVAPLPLRHVDVDMVAPDHRNGYVGVHGAPRRAAFIGQPEVGIFAAKLGDAGDRTVLDRKLEGAVVDPLRPGRRYDGAHVDVAGLDDPFGRDERPPVFDDRRLHQGQRTINGFRIARSHHTRRSREHGNYDYPSVNMRTAHAHWRSRSFDTPAGTGSSAFEPSSTRIAALPHRSRARSRCRRRRRRAARRARRSPHPPAVRRPHHQPKRNPSSTGIGEPAGLPSANGTNTTS